MVNLSDGDKKRSKWRDVLTFATFLAIAAFFWALITINEDVQRSYQVDVRLTGIPENIEVDSNSNTKINVTLRGRIRSLLMYEYGGLPKLFLDYEELNKSEKTGKMILGRQKTAQKLNNLFGSEVFVEAAQPDSLVFYYSKNVKK